MIYIRTVHHLLIILGLYYIVTVQCEDSGSEEETSNNEEFDLPSAKALVVSMLGWMNGNFLFGNYALPANYEETINSAADLDDLIKKGDNMLDDARIDELMSFWKREKNKLEQQLDSYNNAFKVLLNKAGITDKEAPLTFLYGHLILPSGNDYYNNNEEEDDDEDDDYDLYGNYEDDDDSDEGEEDEDDDSDDDDGPPTLFL